MAKCKDRLAVLVNGDTQEPLFFNQRDGPYYPSVRLLHRIAVPLMPVIQVDKGAIRFILSGANIMCRGITSAGGKVPVPLETDTPVVRWTDGNSRSRFLFEGGCYHFSCICSK